MSEWREIAEWDWVWLGLGEVLHAVASLENEATVDDDWMGRGKTECGLSGRLSIPGIFSRMSAQRCDRCCRATGMPHGKQSPKNVDECRPVVEARLESLAGVASKGEQ